jgi:hypothetical protein
VQWNDVQDLGWQLRVEELNGAGALQKYELHHPENMVAGLGPNPASLPLVRVLACHQST